MCGAVIMSSGKCSSDKPCQHKVEPPKTCLGCGAKQQPDGTLPCGHRKDIMSATKEIASNAQPLSARWQPGQPITEAMHIAAEKVLQRASGVDGLPQRMLDAMLAAAPAQPAAEPAKPIGYLNPKVLGPDGKIDAPGALTYSSRPCGGWTFPIYAAAPAQPAAQVMGDTPPPCDQELFDQGVSVGLFDIPKWTAEALCRGIAAATEARVDWHYIGGRVHIKALPAARAPADSVQEEAARLDFLIDQGAYVVSDPDTCTGYWLHWAMPDGGTLVQVGEHPTPRAAIDSARKP
jgi:hypothetical protein